MRIIFVICLLPLLQSNLKSGNGIEFPGPDQIFLDGSDHPFRVGVAFGIAVTGEYLADAQPGTGLEEGR
ncbi:hypothetical protein SDC9_206174 [bioreactor metagenome]|uniref:Uncharacterized protein n=1 Tax=bioreactor metagenome TaxID=1076179 RepID=A0A645J6Z8_9ZZZZ